MLKSDCGWVTYFKHRSLHKYTRVARDQDGVEAKNMIDLLLMKKDMLRYVQDMRTVRGMGRGLSNHLAVLCKVSLVGSWIKRREVVVEARRIRSEKLRKISTEKDMLGFLRGREYNGIMTMSSICGRR